MSQGHELGGLGAASLLDAAAPESRKHDRDDGEDDHRRHRCESAAASPAGSERGHGRGKLLLDVGQAARVAFAPDRELAVG